MCASEVNLEQGINDYSERQVRCLIFTAAARDSHSGRGEYILITISNTEPDTIDVTGSG
jgi:hypothetical protein